jgi:PASTA domain
MLIAAAANGSPLAWWQALAAAGSLALASMVAGVIVILGRRTFVGSARPPRTSADRPQRGLVGRRAAAQAAQSASHAQTAAGIAQVAAQVAQSAQSTQAAQSDPGTAKVSQPVQPTTETIAGQTAQPKADPPTTQAAPAAAQGVSPPAAIATTQPAQPPATSADQSTPQTDGDFIRSWIAITLVIALIFFCAFAFSLDDTSLQSTLMGGLIASVGTAVAFYFSSKASDKARQDIINAAGAGNELVPSLMGKNKADATQILAQTSFSLIEDPTAPSKSLTDLIKTQYPLANTSAPRGSSIVVTFGEGPKP